MNKENLLKTISETGYNVGFGAKKHYATYDIVQKAPGIIGFLGITVGIFSLIFDSLAAKIPSATLTVLGVIGVYVGSRQYRKTEYEAAGTKLTQLFNQLRDLCRRVEDGGDIEKSFDELKKIEQEYYETSISEQILFSDWYAHYKFFAQQQIDWIEKYRTFTLRDKVPLSIRIIGLATLIFLLCVLSYFGWLIWDSSTHVSIESALHRYYFG